MLVYARLCSMSQRTVWALCPLVHRVKYLFFLVLWFPSVGFDDFPSPMNRRKETWKTNFKKPNKSWGNGCWKTVRPLTSALTLTSCSVGADECRKSAAGMNHPAAIVLSLFGPAELNGPFTVGWVEFNQILCNPEMSKPGESLYADTDRILRYQSGEMIFKFMHLKKSKS